jgi:hypothetical protein
MVVGAVLAASVCAAPAAAMPAGRDAPPRILSATLVQDGAAVRVKVVGRDRDDVVRGVDVSWGAGQPSQGMSACTITRRAGADRSHRRRGRRTRFELTYDYPAAGSYEITVRVFSGGCGKRPQQVSRPRTLAVEIP